MGLGLGLGSGLGSGTEPRVPNRSRSAADRPVAREEGVG